jgi:hypothetical protein
MPITSQIILARLLTLKAGLKLEMKGMHKHGQSCYSITKWELGITGKPSKAKVLAALEKKIEDYKWNVLANAVMQAA